MAHIMIADDDELVAELARDALYSAGHTCAWVATGERAWEAMQARRPDLLLLDQHMPGMSGINLLRTLRSSAEFYDLPVIMLTAMTGAEDESRALFAGAHDYVRKPFSDARLRTAVELLLMKRGTNPHMDLSDRMAYDAGLPGYAGSKVKRYI